jgi:hypothetical protein
MRKGDAGVVWWVDIDALHLAGELLLQSFKREQIVPKDQPIVEDVVLGDAMLGVIGLFGIFEQDARLQLGPLSPCRSR